MPRDTRLSLSNKNRHSFFLILFGCSKEECVWGGGRGGYRAKVSNMTRANLFLLFIGKDRTNMATPRGAQFRSNGGGGGGGGGGERRPKPKPNQNQNKHFFCIKIDRPCNQTNVQTEIFAQWFLLLLLFQVFVHTSAFASVPL